MTTMEEERFVELWQSAGCPEEVDVAMGWERGRASREAAYLRRASIPLRRFRAERRGRARLERLAAKVAERGERVD